MSNTGDNMVVDAAAAMDRVAANGLICAYMEIFPYKAWDRDQQIEVWCMEKDDKCAICHEDRDQCVNEFCIDAKYDTSWEWLMPVVENIRQDKWNTHQVLFVMHNNYVAVTTINGAEGGFYFKIEGGGIQSVYEAVVKYLEM
jgi:hypothetical protein